MLGASWARRQGARRLTSPIAGPGLVDGPAPGIARQRRRSVARGVDLGVEKGNAGHACHS
jgi:hypothetical protein